eukprot:3597226-Lingulodinium_polyedra.AAC.1
MTTPGAPAAALTSKGASAPLSVAMGTSPDRDAPTAEGSARIATGTMGGAARSVASRSPTGRTRR